MIDFCTSKSLLPCTIPHNHIFKDVQKAQKVFHDASNQKITTFDDTSHVPFLQKSFKMISNLVAWNKFLRAVSKFALEEKFYYLGFAGCPSSKQRVVSTSVSCMSRCETPNFF
jgi:hypothetical protein